MPRPPKARGWRLNREMLRERADFSIAKGYRPPKWIGFCEKLLDEGYDLELYEAKETRSKYVTVLFGGRRYKVRFSDHRAAPVREIRGDCDFFVGETLRGYVSTYDALTAVRGFFGRPVRETDIWAEV